MRPTQIVILSTLFALVSLAACGSTVRTPSSADQASPSAPSADPVPSTTVISDAVPTALAEPPDPQPILRLDYAPGPAPQDELAINMPIFSLYADGFIVM